MAIINLRLLQEVTEPGKNIEVAFSATNTGKTPAIDLAHRYTIWMVGPGESQIPDWETIPSSERSISFPGTTSDNNIVTLEGQKIFRGQIDLYNSHLYMVYVRVRIDYTDVYGRHHWVQACGFHRQGTPLNEFRQCISGMGVDQELPIAKANQRVKKPN